MRYRLDSEAYARTTNQEVMDVKLFVNGNQELATLEFDVDGDTGACSPRIDALGYRIEGPRAIAALAKDPDSDGLRMTLELPGITQAALVIEKADVKKLKSLMNKDAIKFMVKALM